MLSVSWSLSFIKLWKIKWIGCGEKQRYSVLKDSRIIRRKGMEENVIRIAVFQVDMMTENRDATLSKVIICQWTMM